MKKSLITMFGIMVLAQPAFAGFKEHFDLGQQYLANFQYSGAITEFKNALRINYMDNSARIGLVNSYLARGTYYANQEKNYEKAADDYRAALFYLLYYPTNANAIRNSNQAIMQVSSNLNQCLNTINFNRSAKNRFDTAKQLRAEGNFAAAGYEFNQALADRTLIKDSFEQIGDIMKLIGNEPKAAEYYRKAIAVEPNDIALRMNYAKVLDNLGKEDVAVQEYNFILAKGSDNKDVLYSLERIYKKKLEISPNDADVTANLGAIMQKQGNFDEALMYYKKAESLNPSNINTRLNVGTLYQEKGDYKTAINAYDSVLILYPDNVQANLYKAQSLNKMGDSKGSLERYKKVLALEPANAAAQSGMLDILKTSMTPAQFIDYVRKNMSGINPADMMYSYALDLHKQNKLADAVTFYNEVIKLDASNSEAYLNLAIALSQQNNYDGALATLKTAAAKFPNDAHISDALKNIQNDAVNAKYANAASYFEKKDYNNAIAEYMKIQPPTADSMLGIASAYQELGDNINAIEYYKKALGLNPKDSNTAYYIGVLYAENENWNDAQNYLKKAIELDKTNQKAIDFLATVVEQNNIGLLNKAIDLVDDNNFDQSLPILNQIIASDAKNSYAYYYRGLVYDSKNNKQGAINDFKKAVEYNPDIVISYYMIASDYDDLKDYKNALTYYNKFISVYADKDEYSDYAKARAEELKQNANAKT